MAETVASLENVALVYPGDGVAPPVRALEAINLAVEAGSFVSLIGPSGCGKSTLLRLMADLLVPSSGTINISGKTARAARLSREIGFVFQEPALLEWRRVLDNIALPLELRGVSLAARHAKARDLLALVGLSDFEQSWPRQLSGGMRQRVAIARALSTEPRLLLMDEPFGALDEITRDRLNLELVRIHETTGVSIVFVTHAIREAALLSDIIVVMSPRPGRILRVLDAQLPRPRSLATRDLEAFETLVRTGTRELERGYGHAV